MRTQPLFVALILAGSVFFGPSLQGAPVEAPYGTRDRRVEGQRYETLRALAHHLDETARGALEGAADDAQRGPSTTDGRFLSSVRAVARDANDFQRMVDNYPTSPFEVPAHIDRLTALAGPPAPWRERTMTGTPCSTSCSGWGCCWRSGISGLP